MERRESLLSACEIKFSRDCQNVSLTLNFWIFKILYNIYIFFCRTLENFHWILDPPLRKRILDSWFMDLILNVNMKQESTFPELDCVLNGQFNFYSVSRYVIFSMHSFCTWRIDLWAAAIFGRKQTFILELNHNPSWIIIYGKWI